MAYSKARCHGFFKSRIKYEGDSMKQINLEEISILQMQIFIAAARELNYTRAAGVCNVTQPTVSRSVDALEKTLGLSLLYKRGNRMNLTPAGQVLQECFQEVLCELYRNIQIANGLQKGIERTLRITYPIRSNMSKILAPIIHEYRESTEIQIELKDSIHTNGLQYVLENKCDLMFTTNFDVENIKDKESLNFHKLVEAPIQAYMLRTNPLSCKRKLSFSDFENYKLIVPKQEKDLYYMRKMERWFEHESYKPTISRYCDFAMEGIINIQKDDEILLLDGVSLPFTLRHLVSVEVEGTVSNITMLWRKNELQEGVVAEFIEYMKNQTINLVNTH